MTISYQHVTVGSGKAVHLAYSISGGRLVTKCGAGECTIGTRRRSKTFVTQHSVTCKKCLAAMAEKTETH